MRELVEGNYRNIYKLVDKGRIDILTIHHRSRDFGLEVMVGRGELHSPFFNHFNIFVIYLHIWKHFIKINIIYSYYCRNKTNNGH